MKPAHASVNVALFDMVMSLSHAIDLLHPAICEHHLRVAYAAACIAEAAGLERDEVQDAIVAGALHDIAAVSAPYSRSLLDRALTDCGSDLAAEDIHRHAWEGYLILRDFLPFARAADAIRFHHVDWAWGKGECQGPHTVPLASHILRLADRLAVLAEDELPILGQKTGIRRAIHEARGSSFLPRLVEIFDDISSRESFWLDLASKHKESILRERFAGESVVLDLDGLYSLAQVFARIIDYRSSFTALHSSRVAATSEMLAAHLGLPATTVRLVGIAGYLHDIGKLSVPASLLDKPGRLTPDEMLLVRQHPYYTRQILSPVPGLAAVSAWAAFHHERLDGTGYPFRPQYIPQEARIVAVADVFTAITEDRPYRAGMDKAECFRVLNAMVAEGALDGDIVALLTGAYDELHRVQARARHAEAGAAGHA